MDILLNTKQSTQFLARLAKYVQYQSFALWKSEGVRNLQRRKQQHEHKYGDGQQRQRDSNASPDAAAYLWQLSKEGRRIGRREQQ